MTNNTKRPAFTLIELLILIALVGVLAAVVVPVVRMAREQAGRAKCVSNLRDCGTALDLFAEDHQGWLPGALPGFSSSRLSPAMIYYRDRWNLVEALRPYVENMEAWRCGSLPEAAFVDDPRNVRVFSYGTYLYYAGLSFPDFFDSGTPGNMEDPSITENPGGYVLMQDTVRQFRGWRANHSAGTLQMPISDTNPSLAYKHSEEPDVIHGANILFFDLSVRWYPMAELRNVGGDYWSVMPRPIPPPSRD